LEREEKTLAAWTLPLIVAAIAVSIVGGFYLGGPGLGMAVGALAASSLLVMAARNPPTPPLVPAALPDDREHLLVVVSEPLEDGDAIEQIAAAAHPGEEEEAEVLVLTPARNSFLDRWASDTKPGRERAQRDLVISLASLAGAGVAARASVGDEDLVQAVADQLRVYPATAVILVGALGRDRLGSAVSELRRRLRTPFWHLEPHRLPRVGTST
jgi:hypothetical protein